MEPIIVLGIVVPVVLGIGALVIAVVSFRKAYNQNETSQKKTTDMIDRARLDMIGLKRNRTPVDND